MKMMKSLLLGSAAGLVAIAGAQAADLPVKAKPVDYVRICTAYGAGFYYIPGTDICLRVGGYAYIEAGWNARNAVPHIYSGNIGAPLIYDRDDNTSAYRVAGVMIMDARTQTSIGTVRTYLALGVQAATNVAPGPAIGFTPYMERAFIQFAGFTAGYAASFFDFGAFYSTYGLSSIAWHWTPLFAYTAQFGNGVSATISLEEGTGIRGKIVTGAYTGVSTASPGVYGGHEIPDIVANLRVDQAWGSAQVMGALHQLRVNQATSATISDTYGYAVGGGIEVKTPMIAPGDSIMLQGVYSQGAVEYTGLSAGPVAGLGGIGLKNTLGVGPASDVFDSYFSAAAFGSSQQLTVAWSANLMFRHFWQPNLRSALWVGYNVVEPGGNSATATGADPDFKMWQAGGNIIWSPAPTLDLSLDVLYSNLATGSCTGAAAGVQLNNCNISRDIWSVWTRWRRNF